MKYYLIYWEGDGGDRESYSVFYSKLVIAKDENDAWAQWDKVATTRDNYGILELKPI